MLFHFWQNLALEKADLSRKHKFSVQKSSSLETCLNLARPLRAKSVDKI